MISQSKENNFDLLRLIAALQIASYHAYEHLHFPSALLNNIIYTFRYFFGIHILFTISGFLVFASYQRNPNIKHYFRNRFLRVFPGLWLCLLVTIAVLAWFGYINGSNIFSRQFWLWLGTQVSFFQFYTPDMLRHFGVHNPNGALWTIPVEISFYVFIPILFWLSGKIKIGRNAWLLFWIAVSLAYNILYQPYKFQAERSDAVKLLGVTIGPYLFYFLLGSLAANNWDRIKKWYEGKGLLWLGAYFLYCFIFCFRLHKFQVGYWTNAYHFVAVILLSQATLSLAYTARWLNTKILHHNDFSFGIYIYHMPVINVLIEMGYRYKNYPFFIMLTAISILAYISWKFVEKPALALKHKAGTFMKKKARIS